MLAANSSVGPPANTTSALLTVNGMIPNQQLSPQTASRPTPILTPAYFQNAAFASFPVPFSGPTSVLPCIASSPSGTLFQTPGGPFHFNMAGSMLVAQPQHVLNGNPIAFPSFTQPVSVTNTSPHQTATVVFTTPIANDVCLSSAASLPVVPNVTTSIPSTPSSLVSTYSTNAVESTPIKCKPDVKPMVPPASTILTNGNPEANLATLEKNDFHHGLILEAIDKLRDRKARPDLERISCLLRRQHNIPPCETQLCLGRLAENGSVVCVDYKGNLSYRNPSKWRKTAASAVGITNRPNVSRHLLEAIHSLIPEGGDDSQGFTLFQIEHAIKQIKHFPNPTTGENESDQGTNVTPDLTGTTLRVCLDREATYGKLAKLVDGRYALDETGDRKRSAISTFNLNRKPFSAKIPASGAFGKPPIAPALDFANGKTHGMLSIAPGRPLARRLPFPGGKRGRPPSIKARKILTSCSQQPILPAPSDNTMNGLDKRLKFDAVPMTVPTTTTFVPLDGAVVVSATHMHTLSLPPHAPPPTSGANVATPTAMMMYPGLYNPTVFAVAPEAMVTASFHSDPNVPATSGTGNPDACPATQDQGSLNSSLAESTTVGTEAPKSGQAENGNPPSSDGCCRCRLPATEEETFLVCSECGLQAHPKCLDYWPEVTERARQSVWQCPDCKSCSLCKQKDVEDVILICDACDSGFHAKCHIPAVTEEIDQTLPWICSACQAEGYRVQAPGSFTHPPLPPSSGPATVEVTTSDETTKAIESTPLPPIIDGSVPLSVPSKSPVKSSNLGTPAKETHKMKNSDTPKESTPGATMNGLEIEQANTEPVSTQFNHQDQQTEQEDTLPPILGTPQHQHHHDPPTVEAAIFSRHIRPVDVSQWTVDQVAEWLRDLGDFDKEATAFQQQDIDGPCLMLLKQMSVLTDVGIKLGPAVKIFDRIKQLQLQQQLLQQQQHRQRHMESAD